MSLLTIHTIKLPTFRFPRSLARFTTEAAALAGGPAVCVELADGQRAVLPRSLYERADSYSTDRICRAAIEATANVRHDQEALGRVGFTTAWVGDLRHNVDQATAIGEEQQRRAHAAELDGAMTDGLEAEGTGLVRSIIFLAQAKKVRHLFGTDASDWQSARSVGGAIFEIINKVTDERVRPTLRDIGVDDAVIARLAKIRAELGRRYVARKDAEVDALRTPEQLRAAKALILSELQMLSNAARAILPDDGWSERYQLGRLLGEATRAAQPQPPTPAPTPTPVALHEEGATATPRALGTLAAGTVLTIHGSGGPQTVVVQSDGTFAPAALPPADAPRRGRGKAAGGAATAPRRRSRR